MTLKIPLKLQTLRGIIPNQSRLVEEFASAGILTFTPSVWHFPDELMLSFYEATYVVERQF